MILLFLFLFFVGIGGYSLPNPSKLLKIRSIDKKIFNISKPATLNYVMIPIVGMVDTFWVSKMGSSNELAGAGSGDQIFTIFYVLSSFLPSIITPKISELNILDKNDESKELISISVLLTNLMGFISTLVMFFFSKDLVRAFIGDKSLIFNHANDYLKYRSLGMCASLTNALIFSILRGYLDFNNAIKINLKSQLINVVLDPIFMKMYGLKGVAIASVLADVYCSLNYINLLIKQNRYSKKITKFFNKSLELVKQGCFIQIKNTLNNLMYLYINKRIIEFDNTGILLAANIILIKFLDLSFITFSGLYSVSNIIIPQEKVVNNDREAKERLILWSFVLGIVQSILLYNSQFVISLMTSDVNVINACKDLINYIIFYQIVFGHSYILEGILQGYQKFKDSGVANIISLIPMLGIIYISKNLGHLWLGGIVTTILKCLYIYRVIYDK